MRKRTPEVSTVEPAKTPALAAYRKILARDPCAYCGHRDVRIVWDTAANWQFQSPWLEQCVIAAWRATDGGRHWSGSVYEFRVAGAHRDHVVPRASGGPDVWDNLTAACSRCNIAKGKKSLLHFLLERAA